MSPDYPWYEKVNGDSLFQGDLIENCPILQPPTDIPLEDNATVPEEVGYQKYDVVVMSQSCDLLADKLDHVLLSSYWTVSRMKEFNPDHANEGFLEKIRRGNIPGYHMLNNPDVDGFADDHLIVDFRTTFSVPLEFLKCFAKRSSPRLRVLPPYREHLSQAFARFLMRVGLPEDIPKFGS